MKKSVLVFGSISGLIVAALMAISLFISYNDPNFQGSMIVGYASQLIAFAFIFVGIKNYRDKYNNGVISFGRGLSIGLLIALICSTFYVVAWLFEYYLFMPDFMDKYAAHMLEEAQKSGATAAELAKTSAEMEGYKELYKNPIMVFLFTYVEVLPTGILVSLIAAPILMRKKAKPQVAA